MPTSYLTGFGIYRRSHHIIKKFMLELILKIKTFYVVELFLKTGELVLLIYKPILEFSERD